MDRSSALLLLLLAPGVSSTVASAQSPLKNVTHFPGESSGFKVISAGGQQVTAAWTRTLPGSNELRVASSTNAGMTFSSPATIFTGTGFLIPSQVEAVFGTVVVLWLAEQPEGGSDLFVARSLDGGTTFSDPVNVSRSPETVSNLFGSMIVSGADVAVFWGEDDGYGGIHTARSSNSGLTFGDTLPLSDRPGGRTYGPWVAMGAPDHLYAAWQWEDGVDYGIEFTRSTDYGESFAAPTDVLPGYCCMRNLVADGDLVFLQTARPPLLRSDDGGVAWTPLYPGPPLLAGVANTSEALYVNGSEWDSLNSVYTLEFAASDDIGATFLHQDLGDVAAGCLWWSSTSADGLTAATWWVETDPATNGCSPLDIRDLVVRVTVDGGQTFRPPVRFPVNMGGLDPRVFVDQNSIGVLWASFVDAADPNATLSFSFSTDGGHAFTTVEVATELTQLQATPFDAAQNGKLLHMVGESTGGVFVSTVALPYSVGGKVTGLSGSGLVLENNGGDDLAISSDGSFTFLAPLVDGSVYDVKVKSQPVGPAQYCLVTNGHGLVDGADVTNVKVTCTLLTSCNVNTVSGVVDDTAVAHEACDVLIVGPDYVAEDGASISLSGGREVWLSEDFAIEHGATLSIGSCGQSLCKVSSSPMPYGCHSCVDQVCSIEPGCCDAEFDGACLGMVAAVCGLVCE